MAITLMPSPSEKLLIDHYRQVVQRDQVLLNLKNVSDFLQTLYMLVWKYDAQISSPYINCFSISNVHLTKITSNIVLHDFQCEVLWNEAPQSSTHLSTKL